MSLKIKGYREQRDIDIALVNVIKKLEGQILLALDKMEDIPDFDKRWLNIGRTHLEQGFMAINRSILQPQRVTGE